MALPSKYGIEKSLNSMAGLSAYENGGKGSGNFGHAGRPGKRGGSGSGSGGSSKKIRVHEGSQEMDYFYAEDGDRVLASGKTKEEALAKAIATQKKFQDQAKIVREDIEDRIGQKVKKGEEYTALDEASTSRFKEFHGEDGTEYTYDKENGMITQTNPETGDQEAVTRKKDGGGEYAKRKDYGAEQKGVEVRDGHSIGTEFADLEAQLSTARTNLKTLKKDSGKAYDDLAGRSRYLTRQSEIARAFSQARALGKSKLSTETKKLVREMEVELRSIMADYTDLGTKKYFNPDLNVER